MANEKEIYDTALAGFQAAYIEEEANYRKAQLTGDFAEQTRAFQQMGEYRAGMMGCHSIATDHVASMQRQTAQPQQNKFGLSEREIEIAHNSYTGGSPEEKEQSYSEQRAKLHRMRASGAYRQTTDQTG